MPPEEIDGYRTLNNTYLHQCQWIKRCLSGHGTAHRHSHASAKKAVPRVRRFWFLPHIESPYPAVKAREPMLDPSMLPQSKAVTRLMARFSGLSLRDWPSSSPSTSPSSLERIPSEILNLIAENLAFWDKKALASASRRIYHLLGSVEPPDRFSWRVHMLTSFNRAPNEFFDVTIVQSDDIQQELTRLVKQLPETLKRGHYAFDPAKTRLKDLSCLYFPDGFYTGFGGRMIRCRTLGQFIAIQINEYIGRLLLEAKRGASFTLLKRDLKTSTNIGFEKGTEPSTIASKWRETYESWIFGKRWSEVKRLSSAAPAHSAWEQSLELLLRMGFHIVHGRICFKGKICEVGSDEGVQIRAKIRHKKRRLDCDPSDDDTDDDDGEICYCLNPTNEGPGGGFDFCRADENEDIGAQESNYFNDAMYFHGGQVVDDTRFGSPEI